MEGGVGRGGRRWGKEGGLEWRFEGGFGQVQGSLERWEGRGIGPYKFSHLTLILKDTSTRIL